MIRSRPRRRSTTASSTSVEGDVTEGAIAFARRVRDKFQELRQGDQSKAQRHIFFAEREAAKVPDLPPETKPREIKRVAVIGAGTMGAASPCASPTPASR